jgi:hypothetical protein
MDLGKMAVVTTAFKRPEYLSQSLGSWSQARWIRNIRLFGVQIRPSGSHQEQLNVIRESKVGPEGVAEVWLDPSSNMGPHWAVRQAGREAFRDPRVEFVVFGEEDVVVSDDVLEYMAVAAGLYQDDSSVLAVCAHSPGGQGWDPHEPAKDDAADQEAFRLLPYFNAWCWGTWRNRWESVLEPEWDADCTSGGPGDSGYDWNIHARVLPRHDAVCVVPDASRSQNIGRDGGIYSTPATFEFSQARSFRDHREPVREWRIPVVTP